MLLKLLETFNRVFNATQLVPLGHLLTRSLLKLVINLVAQVKFWLEFSSFQKRMHITFQQQQSLTCIFKINVDHF